MMFGLIRGFFVIGDVSKCLHIQYLLGRGNIDFIIKDDGDITRFLFKTGADVGRAYAILESNGIVVDRDLI